MNEAFNQLCPRVISFPDGSTVIFDPNAKKPLFGHPGRVSSAIGPIILTPVIKIPVKPKGA